MSFIQQNYLWFIIAGIIIVMIIVGYIAEKTDFGHKKIEKQNKPKVEEDKEEKETNVDDLKNVKLADVVYKDLIKPKENLKSSNSEVEKVDVLSDSLPEVKPPVDDLSKEKVDVISDSLPEVNSPVDDLSKEELDIISAPLTPPVPKQAPVVEELNEEIKKSDVKKNSTMDNQKKNDNIWVDKPLEETKNDLSEEEDIWKF